MNEKAKNLKLLKDIAHEKGLSEEGIKMLSRIMHVESNGNTHARPSIGEDGTRRSSARGLFQFTDETWNKLVAQHSDELKRDGRFDPKQQIIAAIYFTRDNGKAMSNAGITPDASQYNLAHFLGVGGGDGEKGAIDLIKEAAVRPNTPIRGFLPDGVLKANGYKSEDDRGVRLPLKNNKELLFEDFSVGDMNNWSSGKMGEKPKYETSISKDYKKDAFGITDPLGNMLVAGLVLGATVKIASSVVNGIRNLFSGSSDDEMLPPSSTPRTPASGRSYS